MTDLLPVSAPLPPSPPHSPPLKKPKHGPVTAYFRIVFWRPPTEEGNSYWFKFDVDAEGGASFNDPLIIRPFAIACQTPRSTAVGLGSKLYRLGFGTGMQSVTKEDTLTDTNNVKWQDESPRMGAARFDPQALVLDKKIYVFGGISAPCNKYPQCADPEAWAEFYDPKTRNWTSLSVRQHNEKPTEKTFQELLNPKYNKDPLSPFWFLVSKGNSKGNISIVTNKGSFSYDVQNQALKTLTPPEKVNKIGVPLELYTQLPPTVIDDWAYYVSAEYGVVCRYNIVHMVEQRCLMNLWETLPEFIFIPVHFPPKILVFRTDGERSDTDHGKMHILFEITPYNEGPDYDDKQRHTFCYMTASLDTKKIITRKYVAIYFPHGAHLLGFDSGILL